MKLIDTFFDESQSPKGHSEWQAFNVVRGDIVDFYKTQSPERQPHGWKKVNSKERVTHPAQLILLGQR